MLGSLVTSKKTRFISQRGPIPNLWAQLNLIQIPTGAKATTAFKSMCVWGGQGQGTSSDICPGNICSGDIFLWWHCLDQNFFEPNFVLDRILMLQKLCGTNFFWGKIMFNIFFWCKSCLIYLFIFEQNLFHQNLFHKFFNIFLSWTNILLNFFTFILFSSIFFWQIFFT